MERALFRDIWLYNGVNVSNVVTLSPCPLKIVDPITGAVILENTVNNEMPIYMKNDTLLFMKT